MFREVNEKTVDLEMLVTINSGKLLVIDDVRHKCGCVNDFSNLIEMALGDG